MQMMLLLLSGSLVLYLASAAHRDIVVDELKGKDSPECLTSQLGIKNCQTLQYAVDQTSAATNDSIRYWIKSSIITVSSTITFLHHPKEIILTSMEEYGTEAIVQCTCLQPGQCGLQFIKSNRIKIQGLVISDCSISVNLTGNPNHPRARLLTGLQFEACKNVFLSNVVVTQSEGFGLIIINNTGEVKINNSVFTNNLINLHDNAFGGGGVLIYDKISCCNNDSCNKVNYTIIGSDFTGNYVSTPNDTHHHWFHLVYGGGLNLFIDDNVSERNVLISDCVFSNNTSYGGGGMAVSMGENSILNYVTLERCNFTENHASRDARGGGGGLLVVISSVNKQASPTSNHHRHGCIDVIGCRFTENSSKFGGGTAVLLGESLKVQIHIIFTECHWSNNSAPIIAAAYIGPSWDTQDRHDFIGHLYFSNCNVCSNQLKPIHKDETRFRGRGIVSISRVKVNFKGTIGFYNNMNTPLYVDSTYLQVSNYSLVEFKGNRGNNGGAIRLEGFSGIHYGNDVTFNFIENHATFLGGAIYSENSNQLLSILSQTCLFQPLYSDHKNVYFHFENNTSGTNYAQSIYLTSINACQRTCKLGFQNDFNASIEDPFSTSANCCGIFTFEDNCNQPHRRITTDVAKLSIDYSCKGQIYKNSTTLAAIPGFLTYIALRTKDDYDHVTTVITTFYVNLVQVGDHNGDNISIDPRTRVINDNHIIIHGMPGYHGILSISPQTKSAYKSDLMLPFKLVSCPPGYVLIKNTSCGCSVNHGITYEGISGCNKATGLLLPGYWAGYILKPDEVASEDTLYIGDCPKSYCAPFTNNNNTNSERLLQLTQQASKNDLEKLMCADNRTGTLCGDCKGKHSVFYNSDTFQCKRNKYCEYGLVFFVIIDLIPIGILFAVLLTLDISLTSGVAYSIIFMVQQVHVLEITVRGSILFKNSKVLLEIANAVYSVFNMEFFNIESLSFCLWAGARTMDVLVVKYFSVVFSMILVFLFVLLMSYCSCNFIKHVCKNSRRGSSYSIAQGLTAFLVICYTQTTRITFNILNRGVVYSKNYEHHHNVVFLDGKTTYFEGSHLWYAIPALLFLVLIVIPPPFLLLFDPLFLKIEDMLSCRFQPWTRIKARLKPIFDSFQNCFKDRLRWFAGMYFLYRTIILVLLITSKNALEYYYSVQALLMIAFTIHSVFQPFVKTKHNVIGSLCLCNLVLINFLTIYIYSIVTTRGYNTKITVCQWIQVFLIYLPIIIGIWWIGKYIVTRFSSKCRKRGLLEINFEDDVSQVSADTIDVLFNRSTSYHSLEGDSMYK